MFTQCLPDQAPLSDEFANNFLTNIYRIWLIPEVQRRLSAGRIAGDTRIWAGQIVFEMGSSPEIRLNDEVNGTFHVHPESAVSEGTLVNAENALAIARNVTHFTLDDHDRPDAAHITILLGENGFYIDFDMRYNSAIVAEIVTSAREFLEIARHAVATGLTRAFIANLHISVESLAKAQLLLHPDSALLVSRRHGYLRSQYNLHSRHSVDQRFARLLNRLSDLRNPARYSPTPVVLPEADIRSLLEDGDAMLAHVVGVAPMRTRQRLTPGV